MNPAKLKAARHGRGWTQVHAAERLGITPAYLNFLEHGKRRLTPNLARRVTQLYKLAPDVLPVPVPFKAVPANDQKLVEMLARLEYPGFAHVPARTQKKNPLEVLLTALAQPSLSARVAEALPWVALNFVNADLWPWLLENARKENLQNRLGFVVALAKRVAESRNDARAEALGRLELALDQSRLAKEGFFYRPPYTETEKNWLRQNRTQDAAHWNLLTDMKPENLQYV